ncbi:hypothetical protein N7456_006942 [Penicillium angulare]|uniref:F-box domain-containing protein n=1 Tax=Penicillium angulare TaxID=116970 RepID=A0A9W9KC41_9EURO|nr:hypothetical protein N7456_006942 [Penicillium angulare]
MPFFDLPSELILMVAESLEAEREINALVQTNRYLYTLLNWYLYRFNIQQNGSSALLWAAQHGRDMTAQTIISERAQEEIVTGKRPHVWTMPEANQTPLSLAAEHGHESIVSMLLAQDYVDVNNGDSLGRTPLFCAAQNGHTSIVQLLLEVECVDAYIRSNKCFRPCTGQGRTPFLVAAEYGQDAVIKALLDRGIDSTEKDADGYTSLALAAENGHKSVVCLLLEKNAIDPDLKTPSGQTPLSLAAQHGHVEVVKTLLSTNSIDPHSKSSTGHTALWFAAQNYHQDVVELLEVYEVS